MGAITTYEKTWESISFLHTWFNPQLLFCVTVSKDFRHDVDLFRKSLNIEPATLREKIKELKFGVDLYTYVLQYTHNLTKEELDANGTVEHVIGIYNVISRRRDYERMEAELPVLQEFEAKYLNDKKIAKLLNSYHLNQRYARRIKSIVLYDDYPKLDDCISYPKQQGYVEKTKKMNREERKQFRKGSGYVFYNELMPKFDENGSYYEIKIYGDTPVECFSLPSYLSYIRKLQKRLPDYRFADIDKRKNLDRDAVYFLLREHEGLNFSEANKALVERFGFEPFTDHRLALDYIKRFKKFAKDESKNRNNSTEFDLNQLVNFNR